MGEHLDSHLETDRVRTLGSPREAFTDVRNETVPVDCLVSEYQLPEMGGLAFLEAVRVENPTLPFIMFTGSGSETLASNAVAADVTDYVRKDAVAPFPFLGYFFVADEVKMQPHKFYCANKQFDGAFIRSETATVDWVEDAIIDNGIRPHLSQLEDIGVL